MHGDEQWFTSDTSDERGYLIEAVGSGRVGEKRKMDMTPRISKTAWLSPLLAVGMIYGQQEKASTPADEPSNPEAIKQFNDDKVAELLKQIADKEDQPAEAVFKNIKILTGGAGGESVEDYADGLQPGSGHELCPLPCSGSMGEGRQETQANRPRYCRRWLIPLFLIS